MHFPVRLKCMKRRKFIVFKAHSYRQVALQCIFMFWPDCHVQNMGEAIADLVKMLVPWLLC